MPPAGDTNPTSTGRGRTDTAPITRDNLYRMIAACDPETLAGTRDRLLLALGWKFPVSRWHLAALSVEDIDVLEAPTSSEPQLPLPTIVVTMPGSGEVLINPEPTLNLPELFADWMLALAIGVGEPVTTGPLFRPITRFDRLYRRTVLHPRAVNEIVQRAVHRAKLSEPWRYSAHSLRLGGRHGV